MRALLLNYPNIRLVLFPNSGSYRVLVGFKRTGEEKESVHVSFSFPLQAVPGKRVRAAEAKSAKYVLIKSSIGRVGGRLAEIV